MKTKTKNHALTSIMAMLGLLIGPIAKWFTPRRQKNVFIFLLGMVFMIEIARYCCRDLPDLELPVIPVVVTMPSEVTPVSESSQVNEEAANMARVIYGLTDYNLSDNAKIAIFETIESRVKCTYGEFGDTINEVCLKPMQWQGFVEGSDYLQYDYELALKYLNDDTGSRLTPEGCYWLTVSNNGVTVRDDFQNGHEWTVK